MTNKNLLQKLKDWRKSKSDLEKVELFRILTNRTIEEIAAVRPKTKDELIKINGIKEKKFKKYGREILDIVINDDNRKNIKAIEKDKSEIKNSDDFFTESSEVLFSDNNLKNSVNIGFDSGIEKYDAVSEETLLFHKKEDSEKKVYSVGEFLDFINNMLTVEEARIRGEITSVDKRERVVYFNLKDKKDESIINCLIFRYLYNISGVNLEVGSEVVVEGVPEIYKPNGRFSFKVNIIELFGEGALKKAYEELKRKLDKKGLFSPERKKPMTELPEKIGLITSNQGAAIGDFMANLGSYGFKIKFINSNVEGKQAVFNLVNAVRKFRKIGGIDALVIIRGGGSFESLQAFNNETLVMEVANLNIPVICGVGHEKDVSLVSLAADISVSTPTAAARIVRESWEKAFNRLQYNQKFLFNSTEKLINNLKFEIEKISYNLEEKFETILYGLEIKKNNFLKGFEKVENLFYDSKKSVLSFEDQIVSDLEKIIANSKQKVDTFEKVLELNNPERQLKLGYSIVSIGEKIVRSVKHVKKGDFIDIKVSDGSIKSIVKKTTKN